MGNWEFTPDGVKVGAREFKLRPGATGEVLRKYAARVAEDSEVYRVLLAAVGSLSSGHGEVKGLLDRVRETLKAKDLAIVELEALDATFDSFFEPAGVMEAIGDKKLLTRFSQETVLRFSGRE